MSIRLRTWKIEVVMGLWGHDDALMDFDGDVFWESLGFELIGPQVWPQKWMEGPSTRKPYIHWQRPRFSA